MASNRPKSPKEVMDKFLAEMERMDALMDEWNSVCNRPCSDLEFYSLLNEIASCGSRIYNSAQKFAPPYPSNLRTVVAQLQREEVERQRKSQEN